MELSDEELRAVLLSLTHASKEMYKAILTNPRHTPIDGEQSVLVPIKGLKTLADDISTLCAQLQAKSTTPNARAASTLPPGTTLN